MTKKIEEVEVEEEFEDCECDCLTKTDLKNFFATVAVTIALVIAGTMMAIGIFTSVDWMLTPTPVAEPVHQTYTYELNRSAY